MTCELVYVFVVGERNVAVGAFGHPSAGVALDHGRKSAAVLEQNNLLAGVQGFSHGGEQGGRKRPGHHFAALQVFRVDHLNARQLYILVAGDECYQSVLAMPGVVVGFHRWRCGSQQHLCAVHLRQNDGCRAGMIARRRLLLLETRFVFLVDDHRSESLKG